MRHLISKVRVGSDVGEMFGVVDHESVLIFEGVSTVTKSVLCYQTVCREKCKKSHSYIQPHFPTNNAIHSG